MDDIKVGDFVDIYDVIIIGAGPAGLTAGMYCARANLTTLIFGDMYDSQLAKAGLIENYPGFPEGIQGIELAERMSQQAKKYGAIIKPNFVKQIKKTDDVFTVTTDDGVVNARSVILCMGARHRELEIPGAREFYGKGVSYCAICDGALFKGKNVVVVGYGNDAAKAALYLSGICNKVTMLCVYDSLRCESVYLQRLEGAKNVNILYDVSVKSIKGKTSVEEVQFSINDSSKMLPTDAVFVEYGTMPNSVLAIYLGLELTKNGFIVANRRLETNVTGVFAAGDVTGGRRQIATAVGEGSSAGISAIGYIKKSTPLT
ncbi:MAG: FAD-dependent oxidoreductase [Methanocellales archaeon]|nr:FAD-dependent oxidoreductase [Methanocellales archaeon]